MIITDTNNGFKVFGDSDERYKIKGGNQLLVEHLKDGLQEQISTGQKLTALIRKDDKTTLVFNNSVEITPDFVIVTIPFSVLRQVELKGISDEKMLCIKELGYGQHNKLILGLNNRVWRNTKSPNSGYLFNNEIHNGWDSTQMQGNNQDKGSYTVFLGGTPSISMANAAKEQGLYDSVPDIFVQKYLTVLDKAFPNTIQQYNTIHKAALWSNNPFSNGSYASYKIGNGLQFQVKKFKQKAIFTLQGSIVVKIFKDL